MAPTASPSVRFAPPLIGRAEVGAALRVADVGPGTWNLSPAAAAAAVTSKSRGIVPKHVAGRPADVAAPCFSFDATKPPTTGEGGLALRRAISVRTR